MSKLEILERLIAALKRATLLPDNTMEIDEYKKCVETMADSEELNSMLFVTALVEIEKEFGIEITDDYLVMNTVYPTEIISIFRLFYSISNNKTE